MKTANTNFRLKGNTYLIKSEYVDDTVSKSVWVWTNDKYEPVMNKQFIKTLLLGKNKYLSIPALDIE